MSEVQQNSFDCNKVLTIEDANEIANDFVSKLTSSETTQNAWVDWIDDAEQLAREIYANKDLPLSGLIIGVKDVIATEQFPTRMGTDEAWINPNMGFDSRIVAIARQNGVVIGGKTKTSEFAVHKETDVINPKYPQFTAGTSSAGSAAAVANGSVSIALATQTAGSIARPASYCGVVGFKPSFGDFPRTGVLKTTDDFDSVGVIASDIGIIKKFYGATKLKGKDYPILEKRRLGHKFTQIALLIGENFDESTHEIRQKADSLTERISKLLQIPIDGSNGHLAFPRIRESHEVIYRRDLFYYFENEIKENKVSDELRAFIDSINVPSREEYEKAKSNLTTWRSEINELFSDTLIISLAANGGAPLEDIGYEHDLNAAVTAAGFPQITIPIILDSLNRNVNMSLSGLKGTDELLLSAAEAIMKEVN